MSRKPKGMFSGSKSQSASSTNAADIIRKGPAKLLQDTLAAIVGAGPAVMFGATRDGSAIVVTFLDGQDRNKAYIEDLDQWRQCLTDLAASVVSEEDTPF